MEQVSPLLQGFVWRPGEGMDEAALERLRKRFPRPDEPMGEAWFMGTQRHMFTELMHGTRHVRVDKLQRVLEEITSGTSSFGPLEEWTLWYHHLLVDLQPRAHECFVSSLLELLIGGFISQHPAGVDESIYPGLQRDMLLTLGRQMMSPDCWANGRIVKGSILHRSDDNPNEVWGWWRASGDFSASLFLCLKYLPAECIAGWWRSVLAIADPYWRAQVLVWLLGAEPLLRNPTAWPKDLDENAVHDVSWDWSHCLGRDLVAMSHSGKGRPDVFLPDGAGDLVLDITHQVMTELVFLQWLESFGEDAVLAREIDGAISAFEHRFIRDKALALVTAPSKTSP